MRQWQDAVDGMHRRDDEMNVIGEKYAKARQLRAERMEILSQNVTRLNMQKDYNEEVRYTCGESEINPVGRDTTFDACSLIPRGMSMRYLDVR